MKRPILYAALLAASVLLLLILAERPGKSPQPFSERNPSAQVISPGPIHPALNAVLLSTPSASTFPSATPAADQRDRQTVFDDFERWADQFLSGNPQVGPARGEALAWKRRQAMIELIETDPQRALELTVPYDWRLKLPANITRHFERQIDASGSFHVAVGTDFERGKVQVQRQVEVNGESFRTFTYGRRLHQTSRSRIPIHGIALGDGSGKPDKMALHIDPLRLLSRGELAARTAREPAGSDPMCGVSGQPAQIRSQAVAADIGGELRHFCGVDHVQWVNQLWLAAESGNLDGIGPYAANGGQDWTRGGKTVLYMRVNFPDDLTEPITEPQAYSIMNGVNNYYTEISYDMTALTTTVTPLITLPKTKAWYSTSGPGALLADARQAALKAGHDTANYDRDIVAFTSIEGYDFGGLAFVGGKGTWLQSTGVGVTSHELGHNYGLWHANFWNAITNSSIIGPGTNYEYGNIFDTMGSGGVAQFNAVHKGILGWIPPAAVHHMTTNGSYRIYPFDAPTRVSGRYYAARVTKDYQRDYWLEFRQRISSNPWLQHGVLLNWSPWEQSAGGTHMLDTTPGSPTGSDSREDSAVVIGRTFTDPVAGIHITPLQRGADGTNAFLDVQLNLGAYPDNSPPNLKLLIDPTNASPGTVVHFQAIASDLDGDSLAYAWAFDDLTFSTNNQPWTFKSWTVSGDHVVRCMVSDMKGGVASRNGLVTVGTRSGFRIQGRVTDIDGFPIEGVHVNNSPTNAAQYIGGYTDSEGKFLIVGVTADLSLTPIKYGYTFTNRAWSNPLTVTSDVVNVDFAAIPMNGVRLIATTNAVPETGGGILSLTLVRSGDISNALTVGLYVSGNASLSDYTLTPSLSNGLNLIEFPADSNSVVFAFQSRNDGTVEGNESASFTLVEDEDYVILSPGSATITILDDDFASRPAVSLVTSTPTVFENGMDSPTFVFSRTGNPTNDLSVNYSVSGSATAGADYAIPLGVAVIPAGKSSMQLSIPLINDKLLEGEETLVLSVTPSAAYTISTGSAQVDIYDEDLLTVTIATTTSSAAEPSGSGRFTVKRDGDLSGGLLVNYTVGGAAIPGTDYVPLSGSVTIPPGAASTEIIVTANDDALVEGDESVIVTLSTNVAYNVGTPGSAMLRIRDNEKASVTLSTPDSEASEPGDDTAAFQISRGSVVNGALTLNLAVSGSAIRGADYVPLDMPVVIPDGASSVTLDVIAFDDLYQEPDENIILTLLASTNYNIGGSGQATVIIKDNDENGMPAVGFSLTTSSAEESESPGISVTLSATSSSPITVEYVIIGGTASNNDYSFVPGPLTFDPGQRAKSFVLPINNDSIIEANETVRLALFNPVGATLDGIKLHTYTIIDDDLASLTVSATAANASETGPAAGNFRIVRGGNTNSSLVLNFEITGTAGAPGDYPSLGTSIAIPAGVAFVDLPVVPVNDNTVEYDETVKMTLSSAPGARILAPNSATITISDNDVETLPVVMVTSTNQPYAVEGGGAGEFVLRRSGPVTEALTVHFTLSGLAVNGTDYVLLPAQATIPIGQSSVSLPVSAVNDNLIEGEETVVLALTIRDNYRVPYPSSSLVTIQDNDQRVRVDASDLVAAEPGTVDKGEFTFTRFGTTNTDLQVFFTLSGSASNGVDYAALSNSFTIPAGSLTAGLVISALDDLLVEGPETLILTLQANPAYTLGTGNNGTVTISDDEPMLTIVGPGTNIIEGARPPGVFRLIRTGDPKYDFMARLSVGGTALYGTDYPPFLTNVYFNCGVTAIDLVISPTNELMLESQETVTASLVPDPAYTILAPSNALVRIIDAANNRTPLVTITSPTVDIVFLHGTNSGIVLQATVNDDSDTNNPPTISWTKVRGPDSYSFSETNQPNTTVTFTNRGIYMLRLTVDDGVLQAFDEVTAVVGPVELLSTNLLRWELDAGSGTNIADSSGSLRNGVLLGSPNWTSNGVLGGALKLAGTNDHLRQISGTNFLNGLKEFSLSLWIKAATTNSSMGIFSAHDNQTVPTLSFATKTLAACGNKTNVLEATLTTSGGSARHVSAVNLITNGWQHLALSWSNGLPPAFYINGQLDQPLQHMVALEGWITNSPLFLVGQAAALPSWYGSVDDVRVFPTALTSDEAAALGSLPPTNYGAIVDAGPDVTIQLVSPFVLAGTVTDDGNPVPPGLLSNSWSLVEGPTPVTFTNFNSLSNTIQFTQSGEYLFRLIGNDGQVQVFDDVLITVIVPTTVDVVASDAEAAELGPDNGQFTFTRSGDLDFDLAVPLQISGTASNGTDFVALTNTVLFPAGTNSVVFDVIPFLDYPIEGDEPFTFTIISNLAYSIGNAEATVVIHDSPYGAWSVQHFTLEELTDPTLSGPAADFDIDGLLNFAEYAANLDPKAPNANGPIRISFEPDAGSNQLHIVITYQRRIAPTDTAYEAALSTDLQNWNSGADYLEEILVTDDGNMLTETVKTRVKTPISAANRTFVTVKAWLLVTGP